MRKFITLLLILITQKALTQTDTTGRSADTLSSKALNAVTVTAAKRLIEVQPDKTILNVDASPAAIGQNALEFLRTAPGVVVDAAENLQMNGKAGVTVYIDGKNTQLSAQDLAQLLKSVEASNIKQIELITNPSAKYDAAGNAGIINIKLKKSLTNGFNGNLTGSWVQSTHARQNGTTNLNWRRGKTAFFVNAGANNGVQYTVANNDRLSGTRSFTQRSLEREFFGGHSLRTGMDYSLGKTSTLGLLYMKNYRYSRMENGSTTLLQNASQPDTAIATTSIAPMPADRNAVNLNYNLTKERFSLSADADYTFFETSLNNRLQNNVQNAAGAKLYSTATQNNADVTIRFSSVKVDVERTFASGLKLESGAKLMTTRTDSRLRVGNNLGAGLVTDTAATNDFRYNEDISAAYASLKGENGKWSWQAGLRAEHTKVQGRLTDGKGRVDNRPDTAYLNLFPTMYLQYKPKEGHQFGVTANRRIDRPSYQDQTPFVYALDALNIEQGNPYLMPQFTNSIELGYTYKYATSVRVGYARTTGYKESLTYQVGKNTVQVPQNAGTKDMISLSISTPLQPTKWWSVYVSATPYYHYYNVVLNGFATAETQSGGSFAFNGYIANNFTLGKGWKGDVSSWFNYQNRATIYVSKPIGSISAGLQKNVLKEKATLKLSVVDIFNTQRWQQNVITNDLQMTTYRKWESQNVTIGFSWRFGNTKIKSARERQAVSEEDAERIK